MCPAPPCTRSPLRSRVHDGSRPLPGQKTSNREVKTGVTNRDDDLVQCEKDGIIQSKQLDGVAEVVWHFVGNARYDSIGPSRDLLNCLQRNGLKFVIHSPA